MAISYAAYRVLLDLFPSQSSNLVKFMGDLGYDPYDTATDQRPRRGSATWPPTGQDERREQSQRQLLGRRPRE
jgi:hypothetical protein